MCVAFDWYAKSTTQAKVCYLQGHRLVIHKKVLWLEVSVHYTVLVAVCQALDELVHHALQVQCTMPVKRG